MSPEELYGKKETLEKRLVVTTDGPEICVTMWHGDVNCGQVHLSPRRAFLHASAILLSANLVGDR